MRPADVAARTEPSSTQPGSCRKAYTVGVVAIFTAPWRERRARSEYTVTFRIADETGTSFGSSTTPFEWSPEGSAPLLAATRLAGAVSNDDERQLRRFVPLHRNIELIWNANALLVAPALILRILGMRLRRLRAHNAERRVYASNHLLKFPLFFPVEWGFNYS